MWSFRAVRVIGRSLFPERSMAPLSGRRKASSVEWASRQEGGVQESRGRVVGCGGGCFQANKRPKVALSQTEVRA